MKLMYIANRAMLKKHGRPMIAASASAMKKGPVLSEVYDLLTGKRSDEALWSRYIRNEGPIQVHLAKDPGAGLLSRSEVDLLNEITDDFGQYDDCDIVDMTHKFAEWVKNYPDPGANTSHAIPIEDILESVGLSQHADAISEKLEDQAAFDCLFSE